MEETVILNFEVDQTEAQRSLIQTEKNITSLRKEQALLNKEYKAGKVTEDQYIESNLRLQKAIKTETSQKSTLNKLLDTESNSRNAVKAKISELAKEYDNLNTKTEAGSARQKVLAAELKSLSGQIAKTSDNAGLFKDQIGNYPKVFGDAASQIKVAGVSVGDFAGKATSLINPATAVAGVISLLGSAFLATRTGAELLESAQFKLQASFQILGRETASLFNKFKDTDSGFGGLMKAFITGNPIITQLMASLKLLDVATGGYFTSIEAEIKALADAKDAYDDLLRAQTEESEIIAKLDRQIEELKTKREEETTTNQQRVGLDEQVLSLETQRAQILISNAKLRNEQLEEEAIRLGGVNNLTDEGLKILIASRNEVANLGAEYATRIRKIKSDIDSLNDKLREELELNRAIAAADKRLGGPGKFDFSTGFAFGTTGGPISQTPEELVSAQDTQKLITTAVTDEGLRRFEFLGRLQEEELKRNKKFYEDDLANKKKFAQLQTQIDRARMDAAATIAGAAASLFDQQSVEYKAFATFQAIISTYTTAQKAAEAAFTPPTVASPALAAAYVAAAIATGLAQVAAINEVQFAEGGWTGPGHKYQAVGIVHADEYVAPKHIVNAPQAQPHIAALEQMRLRPYADGGFVTNQNTNLTQQSMITANALRNLPPSFVSWKEGQVVGRRVQFRERSSKR